MDIGKKIRMRREELGMTQEELSFKLGYKSRSSVNKIENSREVSMKKITLYANALDTTVAYLMGWEDDKEPTKEEMMYARLKTYIELFESIDDVGQELAIANMEFIKKVHPRTDEEA